MGTEIWSSDPATALEWGEANITVAAEKFADAKVGDILHVNLTDVKTGASNPWEAQVELRSTNWKTLTDAVNIAGTSTSEPVTDAAFVLTGDIVKILKSLGAQFNGTGGKVSSITLESVAAATGSDKSIWNGSVTEGNITVSLRHLANARNFTGIKAGDKIRVTFDKTSWVAETSGWIGVQYVKGSGWTWTEIAGETHPETTVDNKWNGDPVEITINTDALAAELNDFENNHGLIIQTGKNTTATQIELLPMYSVNINPEITNGKISVDKPTATDGDEVTITAVPDDGYMLDAISVTGVTSDLAVPVKDGKFTMPADDVTVNATFKVAPVDVAVAAGDITGGDITAAIAAKAAGKPIKDLTLTLTAGAYTVSAPIIAAGSIVVNGATGATIDASALTAPFIALSAEPTAAFLPKNDGSGVTDYYGIDKVDINNVKVTGLKQSIFWDSNKKYCVVDFKIDNCVFALATEAVQNDALIAFQAGGAKDFAVKNSTISGNNAVAKYFVRYNNSARIDRYGFVQETDTWSFTYENNTFYGLLKSDGQWGNYSGITGKKTQGIITVNNNIWVDCDAQTMRRMLNSQAFSGFNAASAMANNVFNREGAVVDQANYGNGSDINGRVNFAKAAESKFDFTLVTAPGTTAPASVGDQRWAMTTAVGYATTVGECTGGTVKADKPYAAAGEKVYATFTPAEGYSPSGIVPTVKNDAGEDVTSSITFGEDETGSYLIMPAFNITVSAVFQQLPKFYIIGDMNSWDRTALTEMTYNKETDKYEYEYAPTTTVYFAFSDKQLTAEEAAADADWSIFNSTNRYALGAGNVDATLNETKSLTKGIEGTIVLNKVKEGTSYKISVEKDFSAVTISGEAAPILPYVVAGSSTELFGTAWAAAAEANAMTLNETTGKYEITYSNVTLSAGDIEYKIVKDGSTWIPDGENKKLNIPAAGTYNVTFTFNPETNEITGAATDATGINGIYVDGEAADIFSDGKPVYNLSGQRVFKGYKGIVIKNGRKIVVK
ncbi:MAG: DUF4957 domain-containing protein [Prevotella sp.]|nr:DUF4957 domain-containing protein [Prevotella sp.]